MSLGYVHRGCCLIVACTKKKYTTERFEQWDTTISVLAKQIPVFYVFGISDTTPAVPIHPNVFTLVVNCPDNYEDVSMKTFFGFKALSFLEYDFIIKLNENVQMLEPEHCLDVIRKEVLDSDYVALHSIAGKANSVPGDVGLSLYHADKVHDPRLAVMAVTMLRHQYASGQAYVVSKRAYNLFNVNIFKTNMYEDYAVGITLHRHNIFVVASQLITNKRIVCSHTVWKHPYMSISEHTLYNSLLHISTPKPYDCVITIDGGLGNQLFMLATGISYCIENNMNMLLCNSTKNVRTYYWDTILSKLKYRLRTTYRGDLRTYKYTDLAYKPIPRFDTNVHLIGFFQSSKYFSKHRDVLMNIFDFPPTIEQTICETYGAIFKDTTVFVHARKGDYTLNTKVHTNLPLSYYEEAKNRMKHTIVNPTFVVTSDDYIYWSSTDIFKNESVVYFSESDILTFYMMTRTKHCIIANSTFSWWGAYLSQSNDVIAPSDWFGSDGPKDYNDIYEANWKQLTLQLH